MISLAISAVAHHGTGTSYDISHPVTLQGSVTEFHYANPHSQLFFDVTNDKGEVAHWSALKRKARHDGRGSSMRTLDTLIAALRPAGRKSEDATPRRRRRTR